MIKRKSPRKYRNEIVIRDGITFHSKKEAKRYGELKLLESAGQIQQLELQPSFLLFPKQRRSDGKAERECSYVADFVYLENGQTVVEDAKGLKTRDYIIKRKAMLFLRGITVREI